MFQKAVPCSIFIFGMAFGVARTSESTPIVTIYTDRAAFNAAVELRYGSGAELLTFDEPTICEDLGGSGACGATYGGLVSFVIPSLSFNDPRFGLAVVKPNELMPPYVPYGGIYDTFSRLFEPAVAVGFDVYPTDALGRTFPGGFEDPFFGTTVSVNVFGQRYAVNSPQFFGVFSEFGEPLPPNTSGPPGVFSLPVSQEPFCLQFPGPDPLCPPPNSFGLDSVAIKTAPSAVPEPATALLLACGLVGLLACFRRFAGDVK